MKPVRSGGGWHALSYALRKARQSGGLWKMWQALRTRNACKTCALGMGGQQGGMVNEAGSWPEVCKKSLQAMASDMQRAVPGSFWSSVPVARLQRMTPRELESCGRLVEPVLYERGAKAYRPISWNEALDQIVSTLRATPPDETFWYFSGRSSNEAGFLLQLFARLYGTNNVNNCSFYCHQASGVGLTRAIGSGTATLALEDLERADLVVLIGGNPASNHPRLMSTLMHVRRRGGQVVVINPVVETGLVRFRVPSDWRSLAFGTRIASLYVQPHIGGDLALLTGIAKRIDEMGAQDEPFLREHCEGADAWLESLRACSWHDVQSRSGVALDEISRVAELYARSQRAVFAWTMGITHHLHGVENVEAIANLALMRGMVGRPHAGLLPIRGHSNVQGIGTVGVTPQLKDAVFERLERNFGVRLPTAPGLDTLSSIEAAHAGRLTFGLCVGGNLFGSNPDSRFAEQALGRLKMIVYLNTTLNTTHAHGLAERTLILPVLARDEEPQPTTQESMFNYVRLSDGGPSRLRGPRSEVETIAELAGRVLPEGAVDWQALRATGRIREAIARIVPGLEPLADIDRSRREFYVEGRLLRQPRFPTASGRAQLHVHTLPDARLDDRQLRLMTVRSEGQFNTVVYEEEDLYRGQSRRDVILLHPEDAVRLGLKVDQAVTVRSQTGSLENVRVRPFTNIRPGNALMYYPEANLLVPRDADPRSRTPAFKNVAVTVEAGAPAGLARPLDPAPGPRAP